MINDSGSLNAASGGEGDLLNPFDTQEVSTANQQDLSAEFKEVSSTNKVSSGLHYSP